MTNRLVAVRHASAVRLILALGVASGTAACDGGPAGPEGETSHRSPEVAFARGGIKGPPEDIVLPRRIGPPPHARIRIPPHAGPPAFLASMVAVGSGFDFSCALRSDGVAFCWGDNLFGQLGDGTTLASAVPVRVDTGIPFAELYVGDLTACGLEADGTAHCWGDNSAGQLGAGVAAAFSTAPVPVTAPHRFANLSLGLRGACGMGTDGLAYCWGQNSNGWQGVGSTEAFTTVPMPVVNGAAIGLTSVNTSGFTTTCGLGALGDVHCWGLGGFAYGNGTPDPFSVTPVPAANGAHFTDVQVSHGYACGLDASGAAFCWGFRNDFGEMGTGSTVEPVTVPTAVVGGLSFATLDSDDTNRSLKSTCAVTHAGDGWCWGNNAFGQLGASSSEVCSPLPASSSPCSTQPLPVGGGITFARITTGGDHACGLAVDGAVYCWGRNHAGQLGDGTMTDRPAPVAVRTR